MYKTIEWTDEGIVMIDQRVLPLEEKYVCLTHYQEVAAAIREMVIRGAPAIGVAAAMGVALGMKRLPPETPPAEVTGAFGRICGELAATRPTAVNLFWAIRRMQQKFDELTGEPLPAQQAGLIAEACRIHEEDIAANRRLGEYGRALFTADTTFLTHCNAGGLATGGYGTALGVIRAVHESGRKVAVFADETRPFLQGARLTAWELQQLNIPTTVITDNMAGHIMAQGKIDAVVVGADRIAANGDTANKIGTMMVAVLAATCQVPFYVAAPLSTVDFELAEGRGIPIEQRDPREVTHIRGLQLTPDGVSAANPAFDVTPHPYITAIITDRGVAFPPFNETLARLAGR
ncbi:MAG: S-methyl-5-thioribose-1-phosphate isomerase [Acidobacteria bacterium]|nr:S-methyl-5-thioribose-1-phosphate isomerase [Acidobacteriota bacterium]